MRILVDVVATTGGGGGRSRARELARTLPVLAPYHEYFFIATNPVVRSIREVAPRTSAMSPPRAATPVPVRLAWEHLLLPRQVGKVFCPEIVLAPFNVAPTWWPHPTPRIATIVSNLAPYSPSIRKLYQGRERARLELLRHLTNHTLAHASHIFLLSEQAFSLIDSKLLDGKAELLPMAPPPPRERAVSTPRVDPARPYVVIAGDLLRFKGIEVALDALSRLEQPVRPRLVVAGRPLDRPYVRSLSAMVKRLGLEDSVDMVGALPHDDLLAVMSDALACVASSRFENPSRVPIEAMSLGVPVIASDIAAFREVCGEAAMYFDLSAPEILAEHLRMIMDNDSLRLRWARAGADHISTLEAATASQRIISALERLDA